MKGVVVMLALCALGCGRPEPPAGRGEAWPEADAMFHRDARFLGADGAYTIDLGAGRVLWLFGDTLVARDAARGRDGAAFLRNSVAVETGTDPSRAFLRYYWRTLDGDPRSFFPEPDAQHWFWPGAGIRVDGRLIIFGGLLRQDGPPGPNSYADDHDVAYLVDNPDDEPSAWVPRETPLPAGAFGEAAVADGDWVYIYGNRGGSHDPVVSRFARADLAAGNLSRPETFCGDGFRTGCAATTLLSPGLPEFSVHHDARLGWLYVGTSGYGATTLAWRTAPRPEGPWSDIGDVYRPPESFLPHAFVYAGKAHPELDGHGALVATYVPSSFVDLPSSTDEQYYFPHFVRLVPR